MFERTALPDGPRVISARLPGARSLAVAVYVLVGSRMETRERSGLAHFMEHITFKGTRSLPGTREVSEAIEGVGGSCNAATDRESTIYWTRLPGRESERAFRVLSDLVLHPLLRDADIEKERDVIVEEIRSYRDDPSHHVLNLWDRAFFGDSPMGWEIAGDEDTVRALSAGSIRDFWASGYRPANMVVAAAGDLPHDEVVDRTRALFGSGNGVVRDWAPVPPTPQARIVGQRSRAAQAHLCLGVPALPRDHPDQWAMELLDIVLGEGSSSRLFLRVREDEGLAYDVHSFRADYRDCGTLQVYAGVDPDDVEPAIVAILEELARLRDEPVPDAELEKARNYAIGRLEIRLEGSRDLAAFIGTQEALHREVLSVEEVISGLRSVTAQDLRALAGRLFRDEALALAIIAPRVRARALERALRLP
jgi:predicted Zn-dependent peptidase